MKEALVAFMSMIDWLYTPWPFLPTANPLLASNRSLYAAAEGGIEKYVELRFGVLL
jgi:hypothetical protein